jgi:hypothetical protein
MLRQLKHAVESDMHKIALPRPRILGERERREMAGNQRNLHDVRALELSSYRLCTMKMIFQRSENKAERPGNERLIQALD